MKHWSKLITIIVTGILLALAAGLTTSRFLPYSQGPIFGELAQNPFVVHEGNGLHYRIFFPMFSWMIGFVGDNIVWTSLIAFSVFVCLILYGTWRKGFTTTQAFLAALFICVTIPAQFTLTYGGFPDAVIYCLMMLMLLTVRRPQLFWLFFTLSLFTHESVVLQLPFLLLYRYEVIKGQQTVQSWAVREVLPAIALAFIPYLAYRYWVNSQMLSDVLNSGAAGSQMYCIYKALGNPLTCMREANLLGWLLPWSIFGSFYYWLIVPVIQFVRFVRRRQWLKVGQYLAITLACAGSFPINLDTTRVVGFLLFPMIMLSLWEYFKTPTTWRWLVVTIGAVFFTPHLYVINGTLRYFLGWPNWWKDVVLSVYPQVDIILPGLMATSWLTVGHICIAALMIVLLALLAVDAAQIPHGKNPV